MRNIAGALAVACAALVALGGCGSGDDETTSVTKAEFIRNGDAVCQKAVEDREAAIQEVTKGKQNRRQTFGIQETLFLLKAILPVMKEMESEFAELETPADDQRASKVAASLQKAVAQAESDPKAVAAGTDSSIATFSQEAASYGFKVCSQF